MFFAFFVKHFSILIVQIRTRFNPESWPMELQTQFSNDEGANQSEEHSHHPLTISSPVESPTEKVEANKVLVQNEVKPLKSRNYS